jgi:hypothetical protein
MEVFDGRQSTVALSESGFEVTAVLSSKSGSVEGEMQGGEAREQESENTLGQDEREPGSLEDEGPRCIQGNAGGVSFATGGQKGHGWATAADRGEERDLSSLTAEDLRVKIPRHQFPLGVVSGSLALVLRTGTRLRRVPGVMAMYWRWSGMMESVASFYSVRMWLLRLGLYQLSRPKQPADDWMWIIDHTMQMGERKCLIIVGLRRSAWNAKRRCLSHEDVTVIDLQLVTKSTGEVVYRQLEAATAKTGVPRAIISDDGRDLHRGIALFREAHPNTAWLYDIKHKTACLLKHELKRDASWQALIDEINHFKRRVALTPLACLLPPQLRGKARYMSVDVLVDWAEKSLALLDRPELLTRLGLTAATVTEKLGWLRTFASHVQRWREMLQVVEAAEHYVRHQGIHRQAAEELAASLPPPQNQAAGKLRQTLLAFIQEESSQVAEGERLLGSSEVLESIIGAFKNLAGERGHHGLTGMVLSIGALVSSTTVATVQTALTEVTNHDVWDWCQSHLGPTLQGLRRRITLMLSQEQKQKTLLARIT